MPQQISSGTRAGLFLVDEPARMLEALDLHAGDMASMIYADPDRVEDESERRKIRAMLLEYCKRYLLAGDDLAGARLDCPNKLILTLKTEPAGDAVPGTAARQNPWCEANLAASLFCARELAKV